MWAQIVTVYLIEDVDTGATLGLWLWAELLGHKNEESSPLSRQGPTVYCESQAVTDHAQGSGVCASSGKNKVKAAPGQLV